MNWPESIYHVVAIFVTSGYGLALLLGGIISFNLWSLFNGMESEDKKEAFLAIFEGPAIALSGWITAAVSIFICRKFVRFQERNFNQQLNEIRKERDKLRERSESGGDQKRLPKPKDS